MVVVSADSSLSLVPGNPPPAPYTLSSFAPSPYAFLLFLETNSHALSHCWERVDCFHVKFWVALMQFSD